MFENSPGNRTKIIELVREYRPILVMTHHWHDLHPDHVTAANLVKDAMYPMGFRNYPAAGDPYRPNEILHFMGHFPFDPRFIVDVSDHFETKLAAIRCFKSQLHNPSVVGLQTGIAQPDFT